MNDVRIPPSKLPCPSASALRRVPPPERSAILSAQAALAEPLYRNDRALTDFDAFGKDDLHAAEWLRQRLSTC